MIAKLLVAVCALATARAAPGIYDGLGLGVAPYAHAAVAAPVYHAPVASVVRAEPVDPNPAYSFSYGVADPSTGDRKDAAETLQNGVVHGSYSLVEPDGHLRRVTYTADNVNGFNAVVERTGGAHGVAPVVAAPARVVAAAPVALHGHVGYGGVVANPWG